MVVAANQAGNANYAAATQVTQSIVVTAISLNFNVGAMSFSSVPLGSTSPDQTLILSNPYSAAATITSIQASGDFSATNNCPAIAPMGTCSVNITFTPTAAGARTGTLTVMDAQSNSPQSIALTGTGTAAGILVVPAKLNFGSQIVSTTSNAQPITIMNTGSVTLTISNVASNGDFVTSGDCASIPAGSNCSLAVAFTPTATGARTGMVTLTGDAGGGAQSQVINLSATGTAAGATLTPSVQTFASTLIGTSTPALNVVLSNTGTGNMTGIGVTTLGDFIQTNTCAATLAPGASCIISVVYAPTIAGTESGELAVTSNLDPQIVSLAGTGLAPGASLNTAQLVYGGQLVGTSSPAQTAIFSNTGSTSINITSVTPSSNFTDTTNCSGPLASGATCSINILFTPVATGSLHGTVTITDTGGTQVVTTQGQGASQGLAVTPSFVTFGAQENGSASQAQTLTLTNTGTAPLTLNPVTISTDFSQANQCPATLPAGASCTISLSFTPTAVGALSGSLVASDAGGLVTAFAALRGQGTPPGVAASPANLFFGSLPVGTVSQAQTITVTNTSSAPVGIGTVSGRGDFAATGTCSGRTIAPGDYCVMSVTITPTTVGTRTGEIQFSDNAGGAHLVALSGAGQQAGVSVFPTNLAFGSYPFVLPAQAATASGTPLSVTLVNTSSAALQLGGYRIQGDFTESDSCGITLAAGAACTLTLQFVPTALGQRTGALTITDHSGADLQMISLLGYGAPQGLTLSPPVLNFGVNTIGQASTAQTATLANNTGQAITDLAITSSGEFGDSNNCGTALANGATCTLQIRVTPQTLGAITGAIGISSAGFAVAQVRKAGIRPEAADAGSSNKVGVVAVLAQTVTEQNATVQLQFATAPAPAITSGGNAGSHVTVQEDDSSGNAVPATDTITLSVAGPGGYSRSYTAAAAGGIAAFNLNSDALTVAGSYIYTASVVSNPAIRPTVASVTVTEGGPMVSAAAVTVTSSTPESLLQNAITFTATVSAPGGMPTGTVNFADGTTVLGSAPLAAGMAMFTTSSLAAGSHVITAIYSGDASHTGATSATLAQLVIDFSLKSSSAGGLPAQSVLPGGTATYTVTITPTAGTAFPVPTILTVSGLPAGATAALPTTPWARLTGTSWQLPGNTVLTDVSLTFALPPQAANAAGSHAPPGGFPHSLWGIVLLPFAGKLRRRGKRMGRTIFCLWLLAAAAITGLNGCASGNGFFGQQPKTYAVTVTVTAGTLSHSTNLTLTVE